MADELTIAQKKSQLTLSLLAFAVALLAAIAGLTYITLAYRTSGLAAGNVMTGNLKVTLKLITEKTATTEAWSGNTLDASRVEYYPTYVLVTANGVTHLLPIERLKQFDVSHTASVEGTKAAPQSK